MVKQSETDNTNRFDKAADSWEEKPLRVALARSVADAIIQSLPLTKQTTALEYGCGTGLVGRTIAPLVGSITAVDSSPAMLRVLEEKSREAGLNNITTARLDFAADSLPASRFDLLFCSMTLHHVADHQRLLAQFWSLLNPDGALALADLMAEDGSFHDDMDGVHHKGIEPGALAEVLAGLGAKQITTKTVHAIEKKGKSFPVFLLTCRK